LASKKSSTLGRKGIETLAVRSKEQDVKIQKVSDRIELKAAAKQLAVAK